MCCFHVLSGALSTLQNGPRLCTVAEAWLFPMPPAELLEPSPHRLQGGVQGPGIVGMGKKTKGKAQCSVSRDSSPGSVLKTVTFS